MQQSQLLCLSLIAAAAVACVTAETRTLTDAAGNISSITSASSGNYYNNADDRWLINVTGTVRIEFTKFDLEGCCDSVRLYESSISVSPDRPRFTVKESNSEYELLLSAPVLVRFRSDSSVTKTGFSLVYDTMPDEYKFAPTQVISGVTEGEVSSSQSPRVRSWVIVADGDNDVVILLFTKFNLGSPNATVKIFSGMEPSLSSSPIFEYSDLGDTQTAEISHSGTVTVVFVTDDSRAADRFTLRFKIVQQKTITDTAGIITSVTDPATSTYRNNADDWWIIDSSSAVRIQFLSIDVEGYSDKVQLYERSKSVSAGRLRFVVTKTSDAINSEFWLQGPVLVRFTSDGSRQRAGFNISFSVVNDSEFTMATQVFRDVGFYITSHSLFNRMNYTNNLEKAWVIPVTEGQLLRLQFTEFDTESPGDTVKIFSGMEPRLSSSPIFEVSGKLSDMPTTEISHSGTLTVVFRTDSSGTSRGFKLRTVLARNYTLTDAAGNITCATKSAAGRYINTDDTWIIDSSEIVQLTLTGVDAFSGRVELYERSRSVAADRLRFVATDSSFNGSEFSLRGPVLVRFTAAVSERRTEFNLSYSVFSKSEFTMPTEIVRSRKFERRSSLLLRNGNDSSDAVTAIAIPAGDSEIVSLAFRVAAAVPAVKVYCGMEPEMSESPIVEASSKSIIHRGPVTIVLPTADSKQSTEFSLTLSVSELTILSDASGTITNADPATGNYANNADDCWLIDSDSWVRMRINNWEVEPRYDQVQLYERLSSVVDSPTFTLSDSSCSSSEFWLRAPVLMRFVSDGSVTKRGFNLTYAAVTGSNVTMATEMVFSKQGSRRSDRAAGFRNKDGGVSESWSFPASNKQMVKLSFNRFDPVTGNDAVQIYTGVQPNIGSSPIFEFSGNLSDWQMREVVQVGSVTVVLTAADSAAVAGFEFTFSVEKSNILIDATGSISSVTDPSTGNYNNNADDRWIISSTGCVKISFPMVDVESGLDKVRLYERTRSVSADRLRFELSSSSSSEFWLSGPVVVRFTSDGSVTKKGFNLTFSVDGECDIKMPTEVIRNRRGELSSHSGYGPRSYSNEFAYAWVIVAEKGQVVNLQFTDFDTESPNDTVKIFSGMEPRLSSSPIFEHSGKLSDMPTAQISHNGTVTVVFRTDSSGTGSGFKFTYSIVSIYTLTNAAGNISRGMTQSTNDNTNADDNWIIDVTGLIRLTFSVCDIQKGSDRVELYERSRTVGEGSPTFAAEDSSASSSEFWLLGPVFVRFVTGSSAGKIRFSIFYEVIEDSGITLATEVIQHDGGVRSSHPDFGFVPYPNSVAKAWVIAGDGNQSMVLHFTEFDTESPSDSVKIFNGMEPNLSSSPIFEHSGKLSDVKKAKISVKGTVTVVFRTDGAGNGRGFSFRFSFPKTYTLTDAVGNINTSSLTDGSGSRCFHDNWVIDLTGSVRVNFTSISLRIRGVRVELYERSKSVTADRLRFAVTDSSYTGSVFWLQGPVLVRVKSDSGVGQGDFEIAYRVFQDSQFTMPTEVIAGDTGVRSYQRMLGSRGSASSSSLGKAWVIPVPSGKSLLLQFTKFTTKSPGDSVKIFSGMEPRLSSSPIFEHSGKLSDMRTAQISYNATVTVVAQIGDSPAAARFTFKFEKLVTLSLRADSIACPTDRYAQYDNNMDKRWLIYRAGSVRIKFHRFSVESCCDKVKLYERSTSVGAGGVQFTVTGTDTEFWLRGPVLVRFTTDGSVTRNGFNMSYAVDEGSEMKTDIVEGQAGQREVNVVAADGESTAIVIPASQGQVVSLSLKSMQGSVKIYSRFLSQRRKSPIFEKFSRIFANVSSPPILVTDNVTIVLTASRKSKNRMRVKFEFRISNISVIADTNSPAASSGEFAITESSNWWTLDTDRTVKLNFTSRAGFGRHRNGFMSAVWPKGSQLLMYERSTSAAADRLRFVASDESALWSDFTLQGPVTLGFTAGSDSVKDFSVKYWMGDSDLTMATQTIRNRTGNCSSQLPLTSRSCSAAAVQAWAIAAAQTQTVMLWFPSFAFASQRDSVSVFTGMEPYLSSSPIFSHSAKMRGSRMRNVSHSGSLTVVLTSCGSSAADGFRFQFAVMDVVTRKLAAGSGRISHSASASLLPSNMDCRWILQATGMIRISIHDLRVAASQLSQLWLKERSSSTQQFVVTDTSSAVGSEFWLRSPALIRFAHAGAASVDISFAAASDSGVTMATEVVAAVAGSRSITQRLTMQSCSSTALQAWAFPRNRNLTLQLNFAKVKFESRLDFVKVFTGLQPELSSSPIFEATGGGGEFAGSSVSSEDAVTVLLQRSGCSSWFGRLFDFRFVETVTQTLSSGSGSATCVTDAASRCRSNVDQQWIIDASGTVNVNVSSEDSEGPFGELQLRQSSDSQQAAEFSAAGSGRHESQFWLPAPLVVRLRTSFTASSSRFSLTFAAAPADGKFTMPTEVIHGDSGERSSHSGFGVTNYPSGLVKAWAIFVKRNQAVTLRFTEFDTRSPSDTVSVFAGMEPNLGRSPIFQHSGKLSDMMRTEVGFEGTVTVVFRSGGGDGAAGFRFSFEVTSFDES